MVGHPGLPKWNHRGDSETRAFLRTEKKYNSLNETPHWIESMRKTEQDHLTGDQFCLKIWQTKLITKFLQCSYVCKQTLKFYSIYIYIYTFHFFWQRSSVVWGLPSRHNSKEFTCQCKRCSVDPWVRKVPWSRIWHPTPVFPPGKFHGLRSLVGYSPWGHKESDTTEHTAQSIHMSNFCQSSKLWKVKIAKGT